MRWSLVTILTLVVVTLTVTIGATEEENKNETGGKTAETGSWFSALLKSIMGSGTEDGSGGGNGESGNEDDDGSGDDTEGEASGSVPNSDNDRKTELVDLDDFKLFNHSGVKESATATSTSSSPSTHMYDESPGISKNRLSSTAQSTKTETTVMSSVTDNPECIKANDMMTYCEVSDDFKAYMQGNTSADALSRKLFSNTVINQLISKCRPGEWCLSDEYVKSFADSMQWIFSGPLCNEGLFECVRVLLTRRKGCTDMVWLSAFNHSLSLLCGMNAELDNNMNADCFGQAMAILHVTLADDIRHASRQMNYGDEFCLGTYVGMTKSFMCTLEKCPNQLQPLYNFGPWQWFMDNAQAIRDICKLERGCSNKEAHASMTESTVFTTTTEYSTQVTLPPVQSKPPDQVDMAGADQSVDQNVQLNPNQEKPVFIIQASDESTRFLIGITTGTIIAVLGLMVLVCAVLKRIRRRNKRLTKDGYAKLPTDDLN